MYTVNCLFRVFATISLFLGMSVTWAVPISEAEAQAAMLSCISARFKAKSGVVAKASRIAPSEINSLQISKLHDAAGEIIGFVGNPDGGGYVLTTADTECPPIKLYSEDGDFSALPPGFLQIVVQELQNEIQAARQKAPPSMPNNYANNLVIKSDNSVAEWAIKAATVSAEGQVILSSLWHQDAPYNLYSPAAAGPGGRALAGCVATAMGMILRHHQSPAAVLQDHAYTDTAGPCQGTFRISDAGMENYRWADMPAKISAASPAVQQQAIAQLLHHCGVAVNMNFDGDMSGAFPNDLPAAYQRYFNYNSSPYIIWQSDETTSDWLTRIKADIDQGRPVHYNLYGPNAGGHSVVCDGYQGVDMIHLNLGWNGAGNAWFRLSTPVQPTGISNPWTEHSAIFGITPRTTAPVSCALSISSRGASSPVSIAVSPTDKNGAAGTAAPFIRHYAAGTTVYLTAPTSVGAATFSHWETPGGNLVSAALSIEPAASLSLTAVYNGVPPPDNDRFEHARLIYYTGLSDSATVNTGSASAEPGEPAHAGRTARNSVWWVFRPQFSGHLSLYTHGSGFDTVLALYSGDTLNQLTRIASNDNDLSGATTSGLTDIPFVAGLTYRIAVASATNGASGFAKLAWTIKASGDTINLPDPAGGRNVFVVPPYVDDGVSAPPEGGNVVVPIRKIQGSGGGVHVALLANYAHEPVPWAQITKGGGAPLVGDVSIRVAPNPTYQARSCYVSLEGSSSIIITTLRQAGKTPHADFTVSGSRFLAPLSADGNSVINRGGQLAVEIEVRNIGLLGAQAGACSAKLDGVDLPPAFVDVGELLPNASRLVALTLPRLDFGLHRIELRADATNRTRELDETNNRLFVDFTVVSPPPAQSITFPQLSPATYGDAPVTLAASASSGLPVSFAVISGPASISNDNKLSITGAGLVTIRATQAGNGTYEAAPSVERTFTVTKASQTITFPAIATNTLGTAPFTVPATASSGLPVTLAYVSGPATLSGNTVTLTGAGTVTLRASQPGNANYNAAATVDRAFTVMSKPALTTQPVSLFKIVGASASFKVVATGSPAPTYQWRFNGKNISGATAATYTIAKTASTQAGDYTVVVKNAAGSVTSSAARLAFGTKPKITKQPAAAAIVEGKPVTFSVTATGSSTLTYQWRFKGVNITGATRSSCSIAKVATTQAGDYSVVVKNAYGTVTSANARLTVNRPARIATQPAAATVVLGSPVTFKVVATGSGTLTYQWRFRGKTITGATKPSYVIAKTASTHAGDYSVVVKNAYGTATSANARLVFGTKPKITKQPVARTVAESAAVTFSVTATGSPAPAYQWRRNGANISGATSASLTFAASLTNGGDYTVVVRNVLGSVTSSVARLTVNPGPAPLALPAGSMITYTGSGTDSLDGPFEETKSITTGADNSIEGGSYTYTRTGPSTATISYEVFTEEIDYTETETASLSLTFTTASSGDCSSAGDYQGSHLLDGDYQGSFSSSGSFTLSASP